MVARFLGDLDPSQIRPSVAILDPQGFLDDVRADAYVHESIDCQLALSIQQRMPLE